MPEPRELLGNIYLWKKQHEQAIAELDLAISLDPNNADWLAGLGGILVWTDRSDEAIGVIWNLGHAFLLAERFDDAILTFKKAIRRNPDFWPSHILLAASYSAAGRMEEARAEAAETLRINPDFSLESWRLKCPFKNKEMLERRFSVLRRAGLK
ncbi:MAG: tetratricopeptide repeat protein [Deltaproteobacteria bacterium]|nr:tetratricopeptide repeat protein [Deltaproteobacteria bacterium]